MKYEATVSIVYALNFITYRIFSVHCPNKATEITCPLPTVNTKLKACGYNRLLITLQIGCKPESSSSCAQLPLPHPDITSYNYVKSPCVYFLGIVFPACLSQFLFF